MKKCSKCKIEKETSEFNKKSRNRDGLQSQCKDCYKEVHKKHYEKRTQYYKDKAAKTNILYRIRNLEYTLNYLAKHRCVDCGEVDPTILEFDHRGDKSYDVSAMSTLSLSKLNSEIAKCDVRCANCHRRKTASQFGYYKNIRIPIMMLINTLRSLRDEVKRLEEQARKPRYYFTNYYSEVHRELTDELKQHGLVFSKTFYPFDEYKGNTISFAISENNPYKKIPSKHVCEFTLDGPKMIGPNGVEVSFDYDDVTEAKKIIGNDLKEAILTSFCAFLSEEVQKVKNNPFAEIEFGRLLGKPGLHD